jgi:hypothetical protein
MLWLVSRNRPAQFAIWGSRPAVKADAAVELFSIDCSSIGWAVIDWVSTRGIPPVRPRRRRAAQACIRARREKDRAQPRVVATYDFTTLRERLAVGGS